MSYLVLDPTNETTRPVTRQALRPVSLVGKTVGIITNGKVGTVGYFMHLEQILKQDFNVGTVVIRQKSNASKPADQHIIDELLQWDAVVTGIGD